MGKKDKSKKKKNKFILKLIIVALIIGAFLLYKPEFIPDPKYQQLATDLRQQIITSLPKQALLPQASSSSTINFSQLSSVLQSGQVLGEEDIYVEQAAQEIYQLIQDLPQDKLKLIRAEICKDLVQQAIQEASSSSN